MYTLCYIKNMETRLTRLYLEDWAKIREISDMSDSPRRITSAEIVHVALEAYYDRVMYKREINSTIDNA